MKKYMFFIKKLKLIFLSTITVLITCEVLIFALYSKQPQILFPNHIILNNINCNDQNMSGCKPARFNNILGWNTKEKNPYEDGIRESSTNKFSKEPCVAAFGDSFTYSNDVEAEYSWTSLLGKMLNCEVTNYGVGGYSVVQAIKKFEFYKPKQKIIILAVYEEMLKRNLSSSNYFIKGKNTSEIYLRPFINQKKIIVEIPKILNESSFYKHLYSDWYSRSPIITFSYLYNWLQYTFFEKELDHKNFGYYNYKNSIWNHETPNFWAINNILIINSIKLFKDKNVLMVFIPSSKHLERSDDIDKLIKKINFTDNFCFANPAKYILNEKINNNDLLGKTGHFNKQGELLLAKAIFNKLQDCQKYWK